MCITANYDVMPTSYSFWMWNKDLMTGGTVCCLAKLAQSTLQTSSLLNPLSKTNFTHMGNFMVLISTRRTDLSFDYNSPSSNGRLFKQYTSNQLNRQIKWCEGPKLYSSQVSFRRTWMQLLDVAHMVLKHKRLHWKRHATGNWKNMWEGKPKGQNPLLLVE